MLKTLKIQNFAIVDSAEVTFGQGFNVITGETGAGKSLIIDALNVALGERIHKDMIRDGAKTAEVEAIFDLKNGEVLTLRRVVPLSGSSKVWINNKNSSVQALKKISQKLVDLHGQHEHQYLLNEDHHAGYLDSFGNYENLLIEVHDLYKKLTDAIRHLHEYEIMKNKLDDQRQLYEFQLNELNQFNFKLDEQKKLERDLMVLENAQELMETSNSALNLISGRDRLIDSLQLLIKDLKDIGKIDDQVLPFIQELETVEISIESVQDFIDSFSSKLEADPLSLEKSRQRLNQINMVCQKYNKAFGELIAYQEEISKWLSEADSGIFDKEKLEKEIMELTQSYSEKAELLRKKRQITGVDLGKQIRARLKHMGIPQAQFDVVVELEPHEKGIALIKNKRYQGTANGIDLVSFWMQANKGETLKPLSRIASGGEISRIMLALKTIMAGKDGIATVVFDEIDVGISGRIARTVGHEMRKLGEFHQVIAITHLPQIASLAHNHYRAEKVEINERTVTRISLLENQERINEIALLIGDGKGRESSRQTAIELLEDIN